jgi:hypothetical protein
MAAFLIVLGIKQTNGVLQLTWILRQSTGMLTYKDYPQLPAELVVLIKDEVSKRQESTNKFNVSEDIELAAESVYGKLVTDNLELDGLAKMNMFTLDELTKWVQENIKDTFNAVHVQYFEGGTFFFPHVDLLRSKAVNYLITTADATTSFYTPNGFTPEPNTVIARDRISLTKRFKIEHNRWHELDVTLVHSVENINGVRIAVTLSLV